MNRFIGFTLKIRTNIFIRNTFVPQCRLYYQYSKVRFTAIDSLDYILKELQSTVHKCERIHQKNVDEVMRRISLGITQSQSIDLLDVFRHANHTNNYDEILTRIWSELNTKNDLLNADHFKIMLRHYAFIGKADDAQTMFNKLTDVGYKHNSKSYQHLIGAYANAGDLEKVNGLVYTMIDKGLYLTDKIYNYRLQCHLKIGDVAGAFASWNVLMSEGVYIDKYSLRAFCQYFTKIGNLNKLKYILDRCEQERAEELSWLILMSINDFTVNGYVDHIHSLIPKLESTFNLEKSFKHSIEHFVRSGNGALIVKILKSIDMDKPEMAKYLMNELVLQGSNVDQVNEIWENLTLMGITIERNFDVYQRCHSVQSIDLIEKVLQHMHAHEMEIQDHMFRQWIILSAKLYKDHMKTIVNISHNFQFRPTSSFIQDTILPLMNWKTDPEATLAQLHTTLSEQCRHNCNVALINILLNDNDIRRAYEIAEHSNTNPTQVEMRLIRAYQHSHDTEYFVRFIRLIVDRMSTSKLEKMDVIDKQNQFVENIVHVIIGDTQISDDIKVACLSALVERGFFISEQFAVQLINELREAEDELSSLLGKLSKQSDELRAVLQIFPGDYDTMSSDEIANVLKVKTMYGQKTFLCLKKLLRAYIREGNIEGIESIRANAQIVLSANNYIHLIQLYVKRRNAAATMQLLSDACTNFGPLPDFFTKALDIIELMTNHLRTMDDVDIFYSKQEHSENNDKDNNKGITNTLTCDETNRSPSFILDPLFTEHILNRKNLRMANAALDLIGSIMSVHLKQAEPSKAVDLFERMAKSFRIVAIPDVLLNTLIKLENNDLLQRVESALATARGEDQAQIAIAIAYIECSQPEKAKHIFQSLTTDTVAISAAIGRKCRLFSRQSRVEAMEYLLEATNGLAIDRASIYESLLDIYVDGHFIDKALQLHQTYLMDKQIAPTEKFVQTLNKLRRENSVEILL